MKKKFLLSALTVVFMFAFVAIVNARTTVLNIGFDVAGKAPTTVPGDNTVVYSTVTEPFDFSRVVFETSGGGTFKADLTNAADVTVLLKAGKNIAYTVANSNAFCGEIL